MNRMIEILRDLIGLDEQDDRDFKGFNRSG
jgi:hypothetical protein